jgi:hypothetical protein
MRVTFREGVDWKILTVPPCDPRDPRVVLMGPGSEGVTPFPTYAVAASYFARRAEGARLFWHLGDKGWGEEWAPEFEVTEPAFSDDPVWWHWDGGGALIQDEENKR